MPELPFKRISVIGLGYIGLPTAAMFASRKVKVLGIANRLTHDIRDVSDKVYSGDLFGIDS